MTRRITTIILFISVLIAIDTYYIDKGIDFSRIYPFKRVYRENDLLYKIDFVKEILPYGAVITGIEGEKVNGRNFVQLLQEYGEKRELNIEYNDGARLRKKVVTKGDINKSYFTYLLLVLLLANVYFLWGYFILLINPYQYQSRVYFLGTFVISLVFFQLYEVFIFRDHHFLFVLAILFLGYLIIFLGYNIINQRPPKYFSIWFLGGIAVLMVLYSISYFKGPGSAVPVGPLLGYIIICISVSAGKLVWKNRDIENSYIISRNIVIMLSVVVSYAVPCLAVIFSTITEPPVPIPILLCLMLITPQIVGNGILQSTYYGIMNLNYNYLGILLINSFAIILGGAILSSIMFIDALHISASLHLIIMIILMALLFHGVYLVNRRHSRVTFKERGEFAYSLQNIAEYASSPEELSFKLKNIFSEIIKLTSINDFKIVIFKNMVFDEFYINLDRYIEILPLNSDLARFLNINKRIFLKYQLLESSKLREEVVKFLDIRDAVLVLPVFKEKELKIALLIGEKEENEKEEIFSNHEVKYFAAVAHQLYQIIENDRLYRGYITQKRYERELDNASYVQLRLFPKVVPDRRRGLDINFYYRPYLRVIGDYFDFINIDDDRTAVIIGDVSGHGLSASMILSAVNSITYSMLREGMSLEKTFKEINFFLNNNFKGIELFTLFIGIFNKETKELEYLNAGHIAPILVKKDDKRVEYIKKRGKILGADREVSYSASKITLNIHDEIILFTDGIVEIIDEKSGQRLDDERFLKIIQDNIDKNIDGKINEIEKDITFFNDSIMDDITVIGVEIR